jgi:hypothetical protein
VALPTWSARTAARTSARTVASSASSKPDAQIYYFIIVYIIYTIN